MKIDSEMLSAYLDGELSDDQIKAVDDALATDLELQAELEALMAADGAAQAEFAAMLDEPVPFALASAIQSAPLQEAANDPAPTRARAGWMTAIAASIALAIGAGGGFFTGRTTAPEVVVASGWLDDIADYHAVYAGQVRHLVEVPAEEADHIETWLTATLGADVAIPELADHGLSFEGARLLVAAGRPVAQLIYTDDTGQVVAVCQIASAMPQDGFADRTINAFDMVTWGNEDANFVVITDEGRDDLQEIARSAAAQV